MAHRIPRGVVISVGHHLIQRERIDRKDSWRTGGHHLTVVDAHVFLVDEVSRLELGLRHHADDDAGVGVDEEFAMIAGDGFEVFPGGVVLQVRPCSLISETPCVLGYRKATVVDFVVRLLLTYRK